MQVEEGLRNLLDAQKKLVGEYESIVKEFESNEIVNQNNELRKQLEKYKHDFETLKAKYQETLDENQSLKISLREQIIDEKLNILKVSKQKLNAYFQGAIVENTNRLNELETSIKGEIQKLKNIASQELYEEKYLILDELEKISLKLNEKIQAHKAKIKESNNGIAIDASKKYNDLGSEEIDEETIKKRIKHNNIEIKIGLNWVNKLGILLILIGVAYALKYSYTNFFTKELKGIFAFVIGGIFLGAGEWFHRKGKSIFAQGLTGGGIGVLYLSIFSCYFILEIININTALIISVLVTLTALTLSLWYNSKTICSLSLVGGYIPFFTYVFKFGLDQSQIYVAMGYLFILNLLILLISINKKWVVVNYISFLLNVPTLTFLVFKPENAYIGIIYSIITFSMYLFVILFYPLKNRMSLKILDTVLLGLNTSISCIIIYCLFENAGLDSFKGLLAFIFCGIYFLLGKFVERYMKEEKFTKVIFYLASFTFAVLMIPFQLSVRWLAMGWLVEGILMVVVGCRSKLRSIEIGGWVVFGLCLLSFYMIDCFSFTLGSGIDAFFEFKYFAIMVGLLAALIAYTPQMKTNATWKYTLKGELINIYKYFTVINLWVFMAYMSHRLYEKFAPNSFITNFYELVLFSLATTLTAYVVSKITVWYDTLIKYFAICLYVIADIVCLFINIGMPLHSQNSAFHYYFSIAILMIYNVLVFFSIKDLLIMLVRYNNISLEYYPLGMVIYLLGNVTTVLIVQFNLAYESLLFSVLYIAFAFALIIFGFVKKYVSTRRLGLGLSIVATAKLFIFDLSFLDTIGRIIAYFVFGIILLGISFTYQKLAERQSDVKKLNM